MPNVSITRSRRGYKSKVRRTYKKRAPVTKSVDLAARVKRLEKKTTNVQQIEYFKNDWFVDTRTITGNNYSVCLNVPVVTLPVFDLTTFNISDIYQNNMGIRVTFTLDRTVSVGSVYLTYFIVKGKNALNSELTATNLLQLDYNVHWTGAIDGVATQGRLPAQLINKDLFQIMAMRRFQLGNQVYPGQGPTTLRDTHRDFYHKVSMKTTLKTPNGNVLAMPENEMPTKDRYYLLVFWDKPNGTLPANQPPIYINGQCIIKTHFQAK